MKFGFYPCAGGQYLAGEPATAKVEEFLEQVCLAEKFDFDSIWLGQHFLSYPFYNLNSIPMLARAAAESGNITLGTAVILIPLFNPVHVAEAIATLDAITKGRLVFGVGLGYRDIEFEAFGISRKERAHRFVEALKLIKMLWTQDEVDFDGKYYKLFKARPTVKPVQRPHPPVWIAGNNERAIVRAAEMGDAWMAPPHSSFSTLKSHLRLYRESLKQFDKVLPSEIPLIREFYVAKSVNVGLREAGPFLRKKYESYLKWGQDKQVPKADRFSVPFEEFLDTYRFIVADVHGCIEVLSKLERIGFNHIIFRFQWPGMKHSMAVKQIKLIGRKIIPHFKDEV